MKASGRWILFLAGIVVLVLWVHYVLVPSWAIYPMIGWDFHRFGLRIFPWGSYIGLLTILVIGFVLYKLILPTSGSQATKEEEDFCPFCGRELRGSNPIPKTFPGTPTSEEPGK